MGLKKTLSECCLMSYCVNLERDAEKGMNVWDLARFLEEVPAKEL